MSALSTLDARLHEALAAADLSAVEQNQIVDLCDSVVAMVADLPHPGRAARSAVQLLVGETVPALDARVRGEIACMCEVAVVRGQAV